MRRGNDLPGPTVALENDATAVAAAAAPRAKLQERDLTRSGNPGASRNEKANAVNDVHQEMYEGCDRHMQR